MTEPRIFPRGEVFHICNKSISNYKIFRSDKCINRFLITLNYYNDMENKICLSKALREPFKLPDIMRNNTERVVSILAYCIMPDHYHILVKTKLEHELSRYMRNIENSYSHYYNLINNRKGPLWQSRFRAILIEDNETLLHVHRYIHLNPVTAVLVDKPERWPWSSYSYFITDPHAFSTHKDISISSASLYKKFVEDQINYQRTIKGIRRKLLE